MVFTYTETVRFVMGDRWCVLGRCTNTAGSTGGDILTGLNRVEYFGVSQQDTSAPGSSIAVNGTLPLNTGTVTIVTSSNETVNVIAIGTG